jgi:hypothetical protein
MKECSNANLSSNSNTPPPPNREAFLNTMESPRAQQKQAQVGLSKDGSANEVGPVMPIEKTASAKASLAKGRMQMLVAVLWVHMLACVIFLMRLSTKFNR